ncbi:hypothetical protein [Luteolibacter soli]|uniref:Uncharacterized protein n=1 Tax=Luteolibacter soli TaxID=3135280 RepID=A0ABU9ARV8_9BACT
MTSNIPSIATSTNLAEYFAAGGCENETNLRIVQKLVSREVYYCVSSLVSTVAKVAGDRGGFGDTDYDEILDLCRGIPDHEEAARVEGWSRADDLLSAVMEEGHASKLHALYDEVIGEPDNYPALDVIGQELRDRNTASFLKLTEHRGTWVAEESHADTWEDLCSDESIDPSESEVFEHWIVSSWAKRTLANHGERVGDIEGMTVWGRCTTGQSISLDRVWHEIAAEMQILQGQANDWSAKRR